VIASLDEYRAETREQVCSRCIVRRRGAPPCEPIGIGCGVERHLERLIEIVRTVESEMIDPYLDRMKEQICSDCEYQDQPVCPCPLKYLLPLAVSAVETVEQRRVMLAGRPASSKEEIPQMD
jgi:hypothetical protein